MLSLDEFTLERITFEVRYETAFLFWDNSGKVLADMARDYPKIHVTNATISSVLCDWMDEGLALNFDSAKAYVTQDYPSKLSLFYEFTTRLTNLIQNYLKVQNFTRVGCRHVHSLRTNSLEEASALMRNSRAWAAEEDRMKPFGTKVNEVTMRVEDDSRGHTLHISNLPRTLTIQVAKPFVIETSGFNKDAIVIDVDAYTKKMVVAPELDASEFVRATMKNTRENLLVFLGW